MLQRVGTLPFLLEHLEGQTTLAVEGEIDAANTDAFQSILDVVAKADTNAVIVDMSDLDFMDVRGINALISFRTTVESIGRSFVLRRPPPSVQRILEVLGPDMPVELDLDGTGDQPGRLAEVETPASATVYEVIELVGTSSDGWEEALSAAVERASQSLRGRGIAELCELDVHIENGPIVTYRATLKISFR